MKLNLKINIKALILLLAYLASLGPSMLFHHHNEVVAYEKATSCDKAIFYNEKINSCNHESHISKKVEKCFLCDHYNSTTHTFDISFFSFIHNNYKKVYALKKIGIISAYSFYTSNKGPPIV